MATQHLYQRIVEEIRTQIMDGKYAVQTTIPSENELAALFSTSRVTVRKSLQILEEEGLIKPEHGKGYYVLPPEQSRYTMYVGADDAGLNAKYHQITIVPSDSVVSSVLGISNGTMVVLIRKSFEKSGKAVSYEEKYIPYERGAPTVEMELNYAEFPEMFADKYVPASIWTQLEIGVETASKYASDLLGCDEREKLMVLRRTIFTVDNKRIGYSVKYLTGGYGKLYAKSGFYVSNRGI